MSTQVAALRRTPLYEEHKRLGARLVSFAGWEMPVQYRGIVEEHRAVRTAAGLFDVSHMGQLELRGEHAPAVVDYLVTGEAAGLSLGRALYTCACNDEGTILDDLIVYRVAPDAFLIVCNAGNRDKITSHFRRAAENHCDFEDRSDHVALLALQGPRAGAILSKAGQAAASCLGLKSYHFQDAVVANVNATVARTGYTGEDGFEIFCSSGHAPYLFRTLLELGRDDGLEPVGLGARDTLRLEARLALYGNDIDETTNPLEAGLGWIVKQSKPMFIGKEALARVAERGPSRKLVGFEMVGRGIARHGYPLLDTSGQVVGVCTSGGPSPTLGKNIGLGYLPVGLAEVGTPFRVDCRGKSVDATVVKTPFYKRNRGTA
jgi:aminomethyltransferase